ncbi:hypothetical protein GF406_02565 [candidate division KSB1 bacterium]|nr:hypothetical protein [candidate division KSB1 bacterium]
MKRSSLTTLFLLLWVVNSWGQAKPQRTIQFLPSANGHCWLYFDLQLLKITQYKVWSADIWDSDQPIVNLIKGAGFRFVTNDRLIDLNTLPVEHVGYVNGTGIIRVEQKIRDIRINQYIWTPMIMDFKAFVMLLHLPAELAKRLPSDKVQSYLSSHYPNFQHIRFVERLEDDLWVGAVVLYEPGIEPETLKRLSEQLKVLRPKKLLQAEKNWWRNWHNKEKLPAKLYGKPYQVLQQSAAFIRMAQSREKGSGYGQIVRHLGQDGRLATTRDMSYAIVALSRIGHFSESRNALSFMMNSHSGNFQNLSVSGHEWGMEDDYALSLHHYTGKGHERVPYDGQAPVLRLDSPGLYLWALHEYVKHSADLKYLRQQWPVVKSQIIAPLIDLVGEQLLIRRDAGLEDEPAPGKHFTWTTASAYRGFTSAAVLSELMQESELTDQLIQVSAHLRKAILSMLVTGKNAVLVKSLEQKTFPDFLDGALVEAINWEVVMPTWKTAQSTLDAMEAFLRVSDNGKGYALHAVDDLSFQQEHVFVSLRAIPALKSCARRKRAKEILQWMVELSAVNAEIVPQYVDPQNAHYLGKYPMIGMGAGAMILALTSNHKE